LLLLDTGDAFVGGGYLGDVTRGEAIVDGMNLMGYDAMALGPLELSLGVKELDARMREAQFPILSANARDAASGDLFAEPYAILDAGGSRVAVVGLTRAPEQPVPGFSVMDPLRATKEILPEVAQQADLVMLLTNLGFRSTLELIGNVSGIDVAIAALPAQLPTDALWAPDTGTLVVTAEQPLRRHSGRRVGRLRMSLGGGGASTDHDWQSVAMGKEIADDPEMHQLLDAYWRQYGGN
jgi:2',3'-cyclic-nucleotide 2'-phosphodiesterase (5'-nucleotidase family)